jgi:hypothetical protein
MIRVFSLILLVFAAINASSQASIRDSSIFITEVKMSVGLQAPGGDLADRFGGNANLGMQVNLKTKNSIVFGLEGGLIFGNRVKETSVLDPLRNSDGAIIDLNGEYAIVLMMERGFTVTGIVGYLLPKFGPNPNSGLLFKFGAGYFQHKIRIEAERNPVPQLKGDYLKGYDRLTSGITLQQFIGYKYLSNRRLINFYAGLEVYEGFTQSRRSFNYDQVKKEEGTRMDILYGLKFGWILPLYPRPPRDIYY